jgi:hypothetical protein
MLIIGEQRRARPQRANSDNKIGERQDIARPIQTPCQSFGLFPGEPIHRHVHQEIEKSCKVGPDVRANDSAQDFATHEIASD